MDRCYDEELLDTEPLSETAIAHAYQELQHVHDWLGNTGAVFKVLRQAMAATTVRRVLDIGCGQGGLLVEIRRRFGVEVVGFDQRPAPPNAPLTILTGNATTDPLPQADVAICVVVAHHLSADEVVALIQNVSRACERFILLDLVRHPVPLALFRTFVRPFLCSVNKVDGQTSIRRAYTKLEMRAMVDLALSNANRPVRKMRHTVSPLWIRQVVEIHWEPSPEICA